LSPSRKLAFAVLAVVGFLALLELAGRAIEVWVPTECVDYGLGFDPASRLFVEVETDRPIRVTHPAKRRSFRYQRFLAEKPPRTLRIAAVGGSSIFLLQPKLTSLERRLVSTLAPRYKRVEVINAGGQSYGSHRLVPIVIELLDYDMDAVLLYTGHNEFEEIEQLELAKLNVLVVSKTISRFAFVRLVPDRYTNYRLNRLRAEHSQRVLRDSDIDDIHVLGDVFTREDVIRRMGAYHHNLETMIKLCKEKGVTVIAGTVPSNLVCPWFLRKESEEHREVAKLFQSGQIAKAVELQRRLLREATWRRQSSDIENWVIRSLAAKYGVPLADVERAVIEREPHGIPGETLLKDHCHLNDRGNEIWIATYEPIITKLFNSP